jgi:zinc protease
MILFYVNITLRFSIISIQKAKMWRKAVTAGLFLILAIAGCSSSGTYVGRTAEPVVDKSPFRSYTFPNGLELVVNDFNRPGPTSVQVWLSAGSSSDPNEKPGLAHLTEHTVLKGSSHLPPGKAEFYIESMGGTLFGHTGRDFTYLGATVPSGPGWERAEDILYDLVSSPAFAPEQFEKERKAVGLEIKQRERDPDTLLVENTFGQSYRFHPYKNPVTGTISDVTHITLQDIRTYYSRFYIPANMVVVITGDIEPAAAKAVVEKTFGKLPQAKPINLKLPQEGQLVIKKTKTVALPVKLTYAGYGWRVCPADDPDIYPLEVLSAILGGGRSSRLSIELKDRRGIAYNIRSELVPMKDQGMFMVFADLTDGDNLRQVTDELLRQINRLKDQDLVTDDEVERAVARIETLQMQESETAEGLGYSLGYWAVVSGEKDTSRYIQNIKKVTAEDVKRVAQRYIGEGSYTLSVVAPDGN